ncbi:MAG: hypothetical protein ACK6BC_09675 [Cyanobacteriota bacterium]|jgi:hypothetical protein
MPFDPTEALVEALMPIVFGSEPLDHRHLHLVTPPSVLGRSLHVVVEPPSEEP